MTGSMPLIAQAMSHVMRREKLTLMKLLGAVIIVTAIVAAFL